MKVKLYVEGGAKGKLAGKCREGFSKLIGKACPNRAKPTIVSCGSRENAWDRFQTALKNAKGGIHPILLVDSEGPVNAETAWEHLKQQDGWQKPSNAQSDQAHLMVQCMETWLVADRDNLRNYYKGELNENPLPNATNLEEVDKNTVISALKDATRQCKKGPYSKGRHSFDLLAGADPEKLKKALPHFQTLCDTLQNRL